jgi:NTP pyrophosphatase (non-canonical NTP hydrolase)
MSTGISLAFVVVPQEDGIGRMVRYDLFVEKLFKEDTYEMMVNHAALGVCGEAGELVDALKKHIHYKKPLDLENVIEELGDLRFYIQAAMNLFGITEQELLQHNAMKLAKRYKDLTYSDKAAQDRADKVQTINPSDNCNG